MTFNLLLPYLLGKSCSRSLRILPICNFSYFPFCFKGGILVLIAPVPSHCILVNFIHLMVSKKKVLNIFFSEKLPYMSPWQPIKLSDLDKSNMKRGRPHNEHFCKHQI